MGAARDRILSLLQVVVTHNLRQNLRIAARTRFSFAVDIASSRASLVTAALKFG
jgi:ABC-type phosphate transport system ATPase subunit